MYVKVSICHRSYRTPCPGCTGHVLSTGQNPGRNSGQNSLSHCIADRFDNVLERFGFSVDRSSPHMAGYILTQLCRLLSRVRLVTA